MKQISSVILLLFSGIAFSQDEFTFPKELKIDPCSVEITSLNIQRIEQYRTTFYYNVRDSSLTDSTHAFEYIVEYDSIGRVSSFKYDFRKEYEQVILPYNQDAQVTIYFHNDTLRLERMVTGIDTTYYNYYENQFSYDEFGRLENIRIVRPYRGGIIDGVFMKEHKKENLRIDESYEDNRLSKVSAFMDGEVLFSEEYSYANWDFDGKKIPLLYKVVLESRFGYKDVSTMRYLKD